MPVALRLVRTKVGMNWEKLLRKGGGGWDMMNHHIAKKNRAFGL